MSLFFILKIFGVTVQINSMSCSYNSPLAEIIFIWDEVVLLLKGWCHPKSYKVTLKKHNYFYNYSVCQIIIYFFISTFQFYYSQFLYMLVVRKLLCFGIVCRQLYCKASELILFMKMLHLFEFLYIKLSIGTCKIPW